jgi:hypothetical protein
MLTGGGIRASDGLSEPASISLRQMTNNTRNSAPGILAISLICPCCGQKTVSDQKSCAVCHAQRVDTLLPGLGNSITALCLVIGIVIIFLMAWIFGNDMKVGRVLLVEAFGDSLKVTRAMLRLDPMLPYYRIFSFDAYRLAFYLSAVTLPLSILAIWLSQRARRLIRNSPAQFGGIRLATASLALSLLLTIAFSTALITSIPRAIERGREKHAAATRASLLQLGRILRNYNDEFGRYPDNLEELQTFTKESLPQMDYWEKQLIYAPGALVASRETASGFSDYRMISAGPDGIIGTPDDIVMQDGVIVSAATENDLPSILPISEKSQK